MVGLVLDVYVEYLVRVLMRLVQVVRSNSWPIVSGKIHAAVFHQKTGLGCDSVEIFYEYNLDGQVYVGSYKNPFISPVLAERYVARFPKGTELLLRVKPGEPAKSLMYKQVSVRLHAGVSSGHA
jgi:hypothetical protein